MTDSFIYTSKGGQVANEDFVAEKETGDSKIFVLADGLGGHQYGELASKCVVDTFIDGFDSPDDEKMNTYILERIKDTNDALLLLQKNHSANMKSTAVFLIIKKNDAYWTHIGDSRLYYIHNNDIKDITEDHSVAFKKYKSGNITRAQIATDEDQTSLLKVLGNKTVNIEENEITNKTLESGDAFLLCSDGLWEYVYDNEILFDYLKSDNAEHWGKLLLLRALKRINEGNDNLSLITVIIK